MQIPRVEPKNFLGLADKIVGLGKELAGTVLSNSRLTKAGQVQQEKGTERIKAIASEIEAKQHEARAEAAEQAQRGAQKTKEAVNR